MLASGIVLGRLNLPLVHKGDALFHIACLKNSKPVEEMLEEFKEEFNHKVPSNPWE